MKLLQKPKARLKQTVKIKINMEQFCEELFEQKLLKLKDTHDSIANLSSWCLGNQEAHDRIVSTWLNVLKRVKIEQRVILFYLANDVVQYSKKKSLPFLDSFAPAFQKAVTMVREEVVRPKMERLFSIWKQRGIYDENFLVDLTGLLTRDKTNRIDITDFQPSVLYSRLKSCKELEDDTDLKLKVLTHNHISLTDIEKMRKSLKERDAGTDLIPEVEEGLKKIKDYVNALEAEIKERVGLIDLLDVSEVYYADQLKEAKVVVNAYKCFSGRIKGLKRKLEERIKELPSPPLSPDINAPSPSPSPDKPNMSDLSFCGMNFSAGGSFMDGSLLTNNYLSKAFDEQNHKVPSPVLSQAAALNAHTIGQMDNQLFTNLAPQPVPSPSIMLGQKISSQQSPVSTAHPPALPTAFSSPLLTGSMSITPPYLTPLASAKTVKPKRHVAKVNFDKAQVSSCVTADSTSNSNSANTEGNKIEVVTRSQSLDDQNLTLSALLQSLIPGNCTTNPDTSTSPETAILQTPRSPSPEATIQPHVLPETKFPLWPNDSTLPHDQPGDIEWESPESPPSYEKTGYSLAEDVDMRSVYDEENTLGDESMGKDVDHRNLISLTGNCDTDYRSVTNMGRNNHHDNVENIDMDLSDDEGKDQQHKIPSVIKNNIQVNKVPKDNDRINNNNNHSNNNNCVNNGVSKRIFSVPTDTTIPPPELSAVENTTDTVTSGQSTLIPSPGFYTNKIPPAPTIPIIPPPIPPPPPPPPPPQIPLNHHQSPPTIPPPHYWNTSTNPNTPTQNLQFPPPIPPIPPIPPPPGTTAQYLIEPRTGTNHHHHLHMNRINQYQPQHPHPQHHSIHHPFRHQRYYQRLTHYPRW